MTTKRKGLLLVLIYALLIALAIPLHTQKGIAWNESFYVQKEENLFKANKNNHFTFVKTDTGFDFDLTVNGVSRKAAMTPEENNTYRFAFDDGFTTILSSSSLSGVSVGGRYIPLGNSSSITVIEDLSKTPLVFAPYEIEKTPILDGETGQKVIGEWVIYQTAAGQHIYGYETWHDGSYVGHPPTFVTLSDGVVLNHDQIYDSSILYVNAQNEILTNPELLYFFPYEYSEDHVNRHTHCWLLVNTAVHERAESRGHAVAFFVSLLYFLGAAQFLWPEQLAFFGSRWQYRYEPELSDAGLAMARFSAVFIMFISIIPLFLPLFMH